MIPNDTLLDGQQETALPNNYTAPEVHDLGNCADLTQGISLFMSEDDSRWC
jgi:hypothetical protein